MARRRPFKRRFGEAPTLPVLKRQAVGVRVMEPILAAAALATTMTCAAFGGGDRQANRSPHQVNPAAQQADRPPATAHEPTDSTATGASSGASPVASFGEVGGKFSRFRRAVHLLNTGQRQTAVRILWFGDSHTAADYLPNTLRKAVGTLARLGGPGYLSLGIPGYRHGLARVWSEGNLELAPHPPARRSLESDGVFGLGGTRVTLVDTSAFITARAVNAGANAEPMLFQLAYRFTNDTDVLRIKAGDERFELTSATAPPTLRDIRQFDWKAPSDTTVEIRALHGKPQVFGIIMEHQRPGVVLDTLGINGARFGTFLAWQEDVTVALVMQRAPSLFVIAYGTNEVFDAEPSERHARRLEEVVARLRRGAPDADCLVVGPTDAAKGGEATRARTASIDAAERATAERLGCEYFSPFELMIADGGYESWARSDPPLALSDGIHLTVRGYTRLGEALSKVLLETP